MSMSDLYYEPVDFEPMEDDLPYSDPDGGPVWVIDDEPDPDLARDLRMEEEFDGRWDR